MSHRDECDLGCGFVHSLPCEDEYEIGGRAFVCDRAFHHPGDHEVTCPDGWVAHWTYESFWREYPVWTMVLS